MKVACTIFLLLLLSLSASAQNLVVNPSFEENRFCDSEQTVYDNNLDSACPGWGAIDIGGNYHNYCSKTKYGKIPKSGAGYQHPRTGKAYASFRLGANEPIPIRSYPQGSLIKPLEEGKHYKVGFYVSLADSNQAVSNNNYGQTSSVNRMGLVFSRNSDSIKREHTSIPIVTTPDIENDPSRQLHDTAGWMEISGIHKARGGERFFAIGNFAHPDSVTYEPIFDLQRDWYWSSYFLDDVSIIPILDLGNDTIICNSGAYLLSPFTDGAPVKWSTGATGPSLLVTQPGTYWAECGISGYTVRDTVTVGFENFYIDLGADVTLCQGEKHVIELPDTLAEYTWSDGTHGNKIEMIAGGAYQVTAKKGACTVSDGINVRFETFPEIDLPTDTQICAGDAWLISLDIEGWSITWEDGSTGKSRLAENEGLYEVKVSNTCGTATASFRVTHEHCNCEIYFPTAFTPGNDSLNETFLPITACPYTGYRLKIYNIWGQRIYETTDPAKGWTGEDGKGPVPVGRYLYNLDAETINGQVFRKKGFFYLVR